MDKRQRIYYTKAQIINGLNTIGKEWMYTDGTEYIGQYHKYTTGEVFSDTSYVDGKSRKLIPYKDVKTKNNPSLTGIDYEKNFEYDIVKDITIQKSTIPNPDGIQPTRDDVKRGYMTRYFAYKVNDYRITELSKDDYDNVGKDGGLDKVLWKKITMRWKISGPISDVMDDSGNVIESGILDTNTRTVLLTADICPTLLTYITDYTKYSIV